jgi:hypothetical protein
MNGSSLNIINRMWTARHRWVEYDSFRGVLSLLCVGNPAAQLWDSRGTARLKSLCVGEVEEAAECENFYFELFKLPEKVMFIQHKPELLRKFYIRSCWKNLLFCFEKDVVLSEVVNIIFFWNS